MNGSAKCRKWGGLVWLGDTQGHGSCAKHLTVESYTDIYASTQLRLLLLVFHHPLSFIPDLNPAFSAILLTAAFLFLLQD